MWLKVIGDFSLFVLSFLELLWKAPELLREADPPLCGTKKGDVYSFAIILEEFHTLKSPYSNSDIPARGTYQTLHNFFSLETFRLTTNFAIKIKRTPGKGSPGSLA